METKKIEVQLLIRKSPKVVFKAFVDPKITTQFWFTKSSGNLEKGKTIIWEWEMYGVKDEVKVLEIHPEKKITIVWGDPKSKVDFLFEEFKKIKRWLKLFVMTSSIKKKICYQRCSTILVGLRLCWMV